MLELITKPSCSFCLRTVDKIGSTRLVLIENRTIGICYICALKAVCIFLEVESEVESEVEGETKSAKTFNK